MLITTSEMLPPTYCSWPLRRPLIQATMQGVVQLLNCIAALLLAYGLKCTVEVKEHGSQGLSMLQTCDKYLCEQ